MAAEKMVLDSASKGPARPLAPPDEKFWKRYSPYHEAPLSGVSSTMLHILVIGLLILILKMKFDKDEIPPVNVDGVRIVPKITGGGGSPGGDGSGGVRDPQVEVGAPMEDPERKPVVSDRPPLTPAQTQGVEQQFDNDPTVKRLIRQSTQASAALFNLDKDVREQLRKNVNPGASRGKGGAGRDGGRDIGKDMGEGPGEGVGKGTLNQREKRVLRWAMTFDTRGEGREYLNQLNGLGAILAFPFPGGGGNQFLVMRDLKNPGAVEKEDVSSISRIYWVDDKAESVQRLCRALGREVPPFFVAFFPMELERKLLDLELAEMRRRYGFADENRIHETKFDVVKAGNKYDVRVRAVTLNR